MCGILQRSVISLAWCRYLWNRAECVVAVMACNLMTNISYLPTVHPYITPQPHRTYSLLPTFALRLHFHTFLLLSLQFATFRSIMLHFETFQLMPLHWLDSPHIEGCPKYFECILCHHIYHAYILSIVRHHKETIPQPNFLSIL